MSKINLDFTATNLDVQRINENFQKIEDEFNRKVLYRDNPVGEPNEIIRDIDANSNRIYNLPEPILPHEAARLKELKDAIEYVETAEIFFDDALAETITAKNQAQSAASSASTSASNAAAAALEVANNAASALASKNASAISESNAASSASSASSSASSALERAGIALTARSGAEDARDIAVASASSASGSASSASSSASTATGAATTASNAASAASGDRIASEAAKDKAEAWATNPEDVVVEAGKYSAYHWAQKAAEITDVSSYVLKSNNLSDLPDAATARSNLGLGNVDDTSDADKPISTAVLSALALKAPSDHVGATGSAHGVATTAVNGFMSAADKVIVDGIATGASLPNEAGGVGTYAFVSGSTTTSSRVTWGNTKAGNTLVVCNLNGELTVLTGTSLSGTWRVMSAGIKSDSTDAYEFGVAVRIA